MSLEGEPPSQDAHLDNIGFDKESCTVYDLALEILMIILTNTFGYAILTSKALVATMILTIYFDDNNYCDVQKCFSQSHSNYVHWECNTLSFYAISSQNLNFTFIQGQTFILMFIVW